MEALAFKFDDSKKICYRDISVGVFDNLILKLAQDLTTKKTFLIRSSDAVFCADYYDIIHVVYSIIYNEAKNQIKDKP